MRKIIFAFFSFVFILLPVFVFADSCSNNGATVIYINGIFTDEVSARADEESLKNSFFLKTRRNDIDFILGYNESHLKGIGDLIKSVQQVYRGASLDYDLTNILRQVHSELSTRKVLLVGHSQGTFYTNAAYDYLVKNGVSEESTAVYNVATPADKVSGGGNYLTSSTDKLINSIVRQLIDLGSAKKPLPANIDIKLSPEEEKEPFGGHSLSDVYLQGAPDRIIGDIQKQLSNLSSNSESFLNLKTSNSEPPISDGCFVAPKIDLSYQLKNLSFAVGDTTANVISWSYNNSVLAARVAYNFGRQISFKIGRQFGINRLFRAALVSLQPSPSPISSNNFPPPPQLPIQNNQPNLNKPNLNTTKTTKQPAFNNNQDSIDDLLERVDLLKRQIADLQAAEILKNQNQAQIQNKTSAQNQIILTNQTQQNNSSPIIYYGGGNTRSYSKILISEIQIAGLTDEKEEFVELYNPNNSDVDLSDWYLQRKTKTGTSYSTYAANTLFSGKKISALGYFLVAREGYFSNAADISVDNPLTEDNSLVLKNPNGEISDKIGWGQAQEYETKPAQNPVSGQSVGRKPDQGDTDNNSIDFEIDDPTPKAKNITYIAKITLPPKDTLAPTSLFNIGATQSNISFTVDFNIVDPLFTVSSSGIDGYIFRHKEETGDWQEDAYKKVEDTPLNFSGVRNFTGNDEKNYYFQIKAKDAAGNQSDWLPATPATTKISLQKKILINEIQIDSKVGGGGASDDWVELYNPNNVNVSLGGWSIQKHSSDSPCSLDKSFYKKNFSSDAVISANGFFLIVGTEAADSLKSIADMTIGWSLSDDNTIYAARSQDKIIGNDDLHIVDKVGFGVKACFSEKNPASSPTEAKSIERKKLGLDTDNNSDDFKVSDEPSPKGTFPKSTIEDASDYSNNMANSSPGSLVYNLLIKWQSKSPNIDFYQIQYKLNNNLWSDWLAQTPKTQEIFQGIYSLFQDNVYFFRVRAQDKDGNLGSWSEEIKIDLAIPVIINEVAYAGTNANSADQWLELYNRTDKDIDLTDWKIVSGSSGSGTLNLSLKGVIASKGYFILEKNDDNNLSDIKANQIFSGSIGKNYLYLRDKNNKYIDEFFASNGLDENNFIKNGNHYSAERISPYSFGIFDKNWKINNNNTINGKDRKENKVYGTPAQQNGNNQVYTYYSSSFIQDTNLKKEFSPYLFAGGVEVFKGVNLSIEPGVVVKFYDNQSNLTVKGTLKAIGQDSGKIIFTSFYDDEFGGDTNGDGNASPPAPGNWLSLYFSPDSINSQLDNVNVRYGGAVLGSSPLGWGNAIWADRSSISLKNSIVEKNKNRGLMLDNSDSIIDSVKFLDHNTTDWPPGLNESKAIYVKGGKPKIKNSYFENNSFGIYITSFYDQINNVDVPALPLVENNNFVKNGDPITFNRLTYPSFSDNKATDNQFNAIIFASDISKDMILKPDLPYLIKSIIIVPENITLTLEPGVIMDFLNNFSGLQINGTLKAVGNQNKPITFRPYHYDQNWIKPGNWLGLRFTKTSKNSELENIDISYGGAFYGNAQNQDFMAAIKVNQSSISLKNSIINKNANNGVWLVNSLSTIDSVQFLEHNTSTVLLEAKGIYIQGGSPAVKNSSFKNNYYGIYVDKWHNDEIGKDILGIPVLDNNKFEGSVIADIFP